MNRALKKNPDERYQTSSEMAIDFYLAIGMTADAKTIIDTYPENAELTAAVPKPKPARSRSWLSVGLITLIGLLILGMGAWGLSSFLPSFSKPTATISPVTTDPVASITVPVTGDLPAAENMVRVDSDSYEVGLSPADDYHIAPINVQLNTFWIDQYLTTNAKYQEYMTATGAPPPVTWPGEADHPVDWRHLGPGAGLLSVGQETIAKRGRMGGRRPRIWCHSPIVSLGK